MKVSHKKLMLARTTKSTVALQHSQRNKINGRLQVVRAPPLFHQLTFLGMPPTNRRQLSTLIQTPNVRPLRIS